MIVVASAGGRSGMQQAISILRAGGSALDAVVAGFEATERECQLTSIGIHKAEPPSPHPAPLALLTAPELLGPLAEVWDRWRRRLASETGLGTTALARIEWLIGLIIAAIGPSPADDTVSFVARDQARHLACGIGLNRLSPDQPASQRVILTLRTDIPLSDALTAALTDLGNLSPPLGDRLNLHALARDRTPLGSSHQPNATFLYLRATMIAYAECACLPLA